MGYLDYYRYQAEARGVRTVNDVRAGAEHWAYLYQRTALPWLPQDRTRPIAELACGHGSFLCWLTSQEFSNLAGVDSSIEQVRLAREVGVKVDHADVNGWLKTQPSDHFAALVAIDLVEHLSKDDFTELLLLARTALAPGGSLILRLPNGDSPFVGRNLFNDITHIWTYTPNCLKSLAGMQGFSRAEFTDEGTAVIRDHRWLKVPLALVISSLMRIVVRCVSRERIEYWSPNLWARLIR